MGRLGQPHPARAAGLDGRSHWRFLSDFYSGRFPGSFARGALFQDDPVTGDSRISGTAASLCGIEAALEAGDPDRLTAAIRRLESMYAVGFSFGGIPLIYMGDELALRNDPGWARDPARRPDNRWMHRPWRRTPGSSPGPACTIPCTCTPPPAS
jgi:amylosucrase